MRQRVGRDRVDQDRALGRVGLLVGRRVRQVLRQQAARRVDGGLHVAGGAVDVAAEIELQRDAGGAKPAGRGHLGEAGDGGELLLERGRDRRRHGVGARARQLRRDADGGKVDGRQRGHRQQLVARDAEHQQPRHQQRGADRPPDKGPGDVHRAACPPSCACCGAPTFALAPSVSRYCPSSRCARRPGGRGRPPRSLPGCGDLDGAPVAVSSGSITYTYAPPGPA